MRALELLSLLQNAPAHAVVRVRVLGQRRQLEVHECMVDTDGVMTIVASSDRAGHEPDLGGEGG